MIIKRLAVGQLETNANLVGDEQTKQGVVIDPGDEGDRIMAMVKESGLEIQSIICTHAHFDHIGAAGDIRNETGAKIMLHKDDLEGYGLAKEQASFWGFDLDELPQPDDFMAEGDDITVGPLSFKVMHTQGHSPGSVSLYGEGIVLTGDTIFQGSVGRTDFPGGSMEKLKISFRRLLDLPEDTKVFSGHGPETTIGREKKENLFVGEFL